MSSCGGYTIVRFVNRVFVLLCRRCGGSRSSLAVVLYAYYMHTYLIDHTGCGPLGIKTSNTPAAAGPLLRLTCGLDA